MASISIKEFADKAGVSTIIIMKRVKNGEIEATIDDSGILRRLIDTDKYDPKDHGPRDPGRPMKK